MQKSDNFKGSLGKVTVGMSWLKAGLVLQARALRWALSHMTRREGVLLSAATLLFLLLGTCSPPIAMLDQIQKSGKLRIVTLNSPTTYYIASYGPTGFEYDLAQAFAQHLGVELEVEIAESPQDMIRMLRQGRAHIAAGMTRTPSRDKQLNFGPPLMTATSELVYRVGQNKPEALEDLAAPIHAVADSAELEQFNKFAQGYANVRINAVQEADVEALLYQVAEGEITYTVADSRLVAANSRYYPQLRAAFSLGAGDPVAWAFTRGPGSDLYDAASAFLADVQKAGELKALVDKHFGYDARGGYVGGQIFANQVESKLPQWRETFEKAAVDTGIDWRLLAAIGYQESHWNPAAVSPTGVRGLMMLTEATARQMKVNRLDPLQSIDGGARYLNFIDTQLPESIKEPDRTWMRLAAYNQGYGSLLDALSITRKWGGDPDRWTDVRKSMLMLTQPKWYRQTKYGYARGYEAVAYVSNIRSYYDILVWLTSGENLPPPDALKEGAPDEPENKALEIETPVL